MTESTPPPNDVTYKPSGIDWLGDIPSHWEVRRLKYCIKGLISGGTPSMENAEFWQEGHIPWVSPKDMKQDVITDSEMKVTRRATEETNLKLLPPKSILIVVRSGILQRTLPVAITNTEVTINQDLKAVILDNNLFLPEYFFLLLKGLEDYILTSCRKAVATVDSIEIPYFLNIQIPVPPLSEQLQLIDSIESRTGRVESFLAQKQRFIDLLREQKQAIINEAVTKGLYSQQNRTSLVTQGKSYFADSAPWLANVPKHWEVRRLRYCTSKIGSGVTPRGGAATYKDDGVPLIRSQNVHFDGLDLTDVAFIDEETHQEMSNSVVFPNDVLLNITGASLGRCCHVPETVKEANVNQHVCRVRPIPAIISPVFLAYCIGSDYLQNVILSDQYGSSREGLTFQKIKDFVILIPPLTEQAEIVEYIEREAGRIDTLVKKTEREMSLMQEYRQSMIAEAVTGVKTARNY